MTRQPLLLVAGLLGLLLSVLLWWIQFVPRENAAALAAASEAATAADAQRASGGRATLPPERSRPAQQTPEGPLIVADIAETARQLHAPGATAAQDLEILLSLLDFHRRAHGGQNPVGGENAEIVDQLRGQNAKRLAVLPPGLPAIDGEGRLVDRWGTPYFFHSISRDALEIRTAGPDRKLWTGDDITHSPVATEEPAASVASVAEP